MWATGAAALGAGLAGCSQSEPTPEPSEETTTEETVAESGVETVVSVPGERVPENMAVGPEGALYFGITAGELRRVPADRRGATGLALEDTEQVASLPGAVGVETGPDGTVYVAVATQGERTGAWAVPPGGEASQLVAVEGFPNDILFDETHGRLLVTESRGGVVYSVGTGGSRETWLADDRLPTESFGANGITCDAEGTVYVAVTRAAEETGRLLSVPVDADGAAGDASLFVEGGEVFDVDGITARAGAVYVAANSQNRVVRVESDGVVETVVDADDGLVFPSDVVFDPSVPGRLFVCNFATRSPADGAILRTQG